MAESGIQDSGNNITDTNYNQLREMPSALHVGTTVLSFTSVPILYYPKHSWSDRKSKLFI
jgi:hypothetical protein